MFGPGVRNAPGALILPRTAAGVGTIAPGAAGEFQDFVIPNRGTSQVTVRWFADQPGVGRLYRRIPGAVIANSGTSGFRLAMPAVTLAVASTEDELNRLDVPVAVGDYFRFIFTTDAGAAAPANVTAEVAYKRAEG